MIKTAIITGATGFIGSWLVEELLQHNVDITALVISDGKRLPPAICNAIHNINYSPATINDALLSLSNIVPFFYLPICKIPLKLFRKC